MGLELRPTREHCRKPLPPDSTEAMICSFECTFCRPWVENVLLNVCPDYGGGFCVRPVRPRNNWKDDTYLGTRPAETKVTYHPVDPAGARLVCGVHPPDTAGDALTTGS